MTRSEFVLLMLAETASSVAQQASRMVRYGFHREFNSWAECERASLQDRFTRASLLLEILTVDFALDFSYTSTLAQMRAEIDQVLTDATAKGLISEGGAK
jgi:hypothetical protein